MKKREKKLLREQLELLEKQSKTCEKSEELVLITSSICQIITMLEESRRAHKARKERLNKEAHEKDWLNHITSC